MREFDSAEMHISGRTDCASEAPIVISQGDGRQDPMGHQTLDVLGFGLAGAISANGVIFIYFALSYASG
jgi:hypothetical protein